MANGNGSDPHIKTPRTVAEGVIWVLTRHGPWALGCVILSIAFYYFALEPMSKDREMYATTLRTSVEKNSEAMDSIADSTAKITESVERQEATMQLLDATIQKSCKVNELFQAQVSIDHPNQLEKLNEILKEVKISN